MLDTGLNTLMLIGHRAEHPDVGHCTEHPDVYTVLNILMLDTALNLDFASLYIAGDGTTA